MCCYKAKIVEQEGKIYFEGDKWKGLLDILLGGEEQVHTATYQVVYSENKQSITLFSLATLD
jgi:hypothetical protein